MLLFFFTMFVASPIFTQQDILEAQHITEQLISFETTNKIENPKPFDELRRFLEQLAIDSNLHFTTHGDNDVFQITAGKGPKTLDFVAHADVVEAGSHWKTDPFQATRTTTHICGRGAEDDKSAIAMAIMVLKKIQATHPNYQVGLLIGTAEESDWNNFEHFLKTYQQARYTISIDSSFPVVIGESGFVSWHLGIPRTANLSSERTILEIHAGDFLTQIPQTATMLVQLKQNESCSDLEKITKPFQATIENTGPALCKITTHGKSVHASTPEEGQNPLWTLADLSTKLPVIKSSASVLLRIISETMSHDHYGSKLNLNMQHSVMGKLIVVPTLLRTTSTHVEVHINIRRPYGLSAEAFHTKLQEAQKQLATAYETTLENIQPSYVGNPMLTSEQSHFVQTLLNIYAQETQQQHPKPISTRGGTYAKLFEHAVSFGPAMPHETYQGHQPNECVALRYFEPAMNMWFKAAQTLSK